MHRPLHWQLRSTLALALNRPRFVGIVNVTPDSFANERALVDPCVAAELVARMVGEGADAVDIGGESTRPGASTVPEDEETRRVVPAIRAVRAMAGDVGRVPITIDTTKASVARAALDAGADAINDVSAGTQDGAMLSLASSRGCGIILMHRVTTPTRDAYSDAYTSAPMGGDVVETVATFLASRARGAVEAGIARDRIVVDPGLGFGKTVEQNLELIRRTPELIARVGLPVMSALSRKSFVGRVGLGRDSSPGERLEATLALSTLHLSFGAGLFRVHDVQAHRRALDAAWAALHTKQGFPASESAHR